MDLFYTLKKYLLKVLLLLSLACVRLFAGIDPVSIPSAVMKRSFNALVVLPDDYAKHDKRYPVLYLLHGHSSDPSSWSFVIPDLKDWATKEQMILVCPDGDFDSWYLDGPQQPGRKFAGYIAEEVTGYVDRNYRTIDDRLARGISGISMGGHGAFYLALNYPGTFGLAGSSSGGLDLLPFSGYWNLDHLLGDPRTNNWKPYSCLQLLDCVVFQDQMIWMDCGSDDFFIEGNRAFHKKLLAKNIPHQYVETSGGHELLYWKSAYPDQLRFFSKHFKRA